MKKFTYLVATLLIFAISLPSCEDKEHECVSVSSNTEDFEKFVENFVPDESANIIGKWKLVKGYRFFMKEGPSCSDFSRCNIVYEFKPNGVLTISGQSRHLPFIHNNKKGDHSYSIGSFPDDRSVKINGSYLWHSVSSEWLMLSLLPLDGGAYFFMRVTPMVN